RRLRRSRPGLQLLIPLAAGLPVEAATVPLRAAGLDGARIHRGDFPQVLRACSAGVVAAGTASLEAAVVGLPIVVIYRMNPLTHALARRLVQLDHVALPNLVAGRRIVPELIQDDCTPERIAAEIEGYLGDPAGAERVAGELRALRERLGGPGAYARAAEAVLGELTP
ncbi:MAG TPA: hypothetical protein VJS92_18035, partial [Candidatus Polarisedimenticolaceae bacterium]|nr:hypothetical protein [Candidatus Polarisedimenticolaceae bacterium]